VVNYLLGYLDSNQQCQNFEKLKNLDREKRSVKAGKYRGGVSVTPNNGCQLLSLVNIFPSYFFLLGLKNATTVFRKIVIGGGISKVCRQDKQGEFFHL
jgi:hypothetical protein